MNHLNLRFSLAEMRDTRLRWRTIDALRAERKRLERQRLRSVTHCVLFTYFTFLFLMVL